MQGAIVILSGPVGAGKTTVARELVALLPDQVACIEGDLFWSFLRKGYAPGPTAGGFRLLMAGMLAAAVPFAASGALTIVDFSIPPWYLDTARKIASVRAVPLHYVVLRPPLEICASRARSRTQGAIADYGELTALHQDFEQVPETQVVGEVAPPGETAALVAAGLNDGRFRLR